MTGSRARLLVPVGLTVLVMLLVGWLAAGAGLDSRTEPLPQDFDSIDSSESPEDHTTSQWQADATGEPWDRPELPEGTTTVLAVIAYGFVGAVVLALLAFVAHRLLRPVGAAGEVDTRVASQPVGAGELREALRAGLAGIDAGDDPRAAVIACWLRLEHAAAAAGVERLAAETSTDLVHRLLSAHRVDDRSLSALADAYRLARYAPHDVGAELRDTARSALAAVDAQLAAAVAEQEAAS